MSFKALITQNERGRSMVEILGVLAIVGVLSFGGIQGYKYAMDKHRANDIVNEVNMRATDIWHLYQDGEKELPDSPEADAFPEYGEMTQTGFEILVTSHPPVAFRTWVNDVPSAVCQKVLQENLNDAIQGLKFVQVDNGGGLTRYTGDTAICGESGTMNQMVFTSFLDEDGGAVANEGNGDNNAMESCVENEDCSNLCGIALCDTNTFQCDNACANGQVCKPNEDATSGTCVDCVVNTDCPVRGQICNDLTNTCVTPPDSCELGVTFRSKNGVCIPCEDASNIVIDTEVFEFSDLNIKDELTGVEQCQSCQNTHYVGTNQDGTTFCSIACIKGASYQSSKEGCIPCYNTDGTLNTETHELNNSNSAAFEQCSACGLTWYKYYYSSDCRSTIECSSDQFLGGESDVSRLLCNNCSTNKTIRMYTFFGNSSSNEQNLLQKIKDSCTACPERDSTGAWSKRQIIETSCWPVCEQPEAGSEADVNCTKENATEEEKAKCKRKWQNSNGVCFDANSTTGDTNIGSNERLIDLCQKSGRTVYGGYCVIPIDDCGLGKFKASNGKCRNCTDSDYNFSITVLNEEDSKCVANCHYDEATQKYTSDTSKPSKRYIYTNSSGTNYCYKTCPENQWQNSQGTCFNCSSDPGRYYTGAVGGYGDLGKSLCDSRCPSGEYARKVYEDTGRCLWITCPTVNNVTYFKNKYGECQNCDTASGTSAYGNSRAECHRCDNRIFLQRSGYSWGGYWDNNGSTGLCVSFNPGVSGICNSVELDSIPIPSTLKPSLVSAAADYVSGKYDGLKFRASMTGNCIDCSSQTDVQTTREQCKSCPQRRFSAGANQLGTCSLGQCEENVEFLNINYNCVKCSNSYNRSASEIEVKKKYLCESCENRRIMTQNSTEKSYCVPNDCSLGFEWQTATGGACISCTSTDSKQEIGAESVYREQCEECNRVAYSITDDTKEIWYCSRRQPDNKKYFVNIDGGLTACNTNGDVEIPNTEKAKTICSECLDVAREAYVEDGKAYCSKL